MAINLTNLIPASLVRDLTDIGVNYNETTLSNSVYYAQEQELVDILGRTLYDKLVTLSNNENADPQVSPRLRETSEAKYATLLDDYVALFLVWTAYYNVLSEVYLKPTSQGIGQRNFSGGTPVSPAQYDAKRRDVRSRVDHFATRLDQYLTDEGSTTFPELGESESLPVDQRKQLLSSDSPLIFGGMRYKGPNFK